ncbi:putative transposase, partial [Phenoliferia sp. Uapishka_3]
MSSSRDSQQTIDESASQASDTNPTIEDSSRQLPDSSSDAKSPSTLIKTPPPIPTTLSTAVMDSQLKSSMKLGELADKVEKLKGTDDFLRWATTIDNKLTFVDLEDHIDAEIPTPTLLPDGSNAALFAAWKKLDKKVRIFITECCTASVGSQVRHETTAINAWTKLHEIYLPRGDGIIQALEQRLTAMRLTSNMDVSSYLEQMAEDNARLVDLGEGAKEDTDLGKKLLYSLDRVDFRHTLETLENWDRTRRTFTQISAKLLNDDRLDKLHEEDEERALKAHKALAARADVRRGGSSPPSEDSDRTKKPCQNPRCENGRHHSWNQCWSDGGGRAGHEKEDRKSLEKKRDDWKKKDEKKAKGKGKVKEKAAAAQDVDADDEQSDNSEAYASESESTLAALARNPFAGLMVEGEETWIADSGSTSNLKTSVPTGCKPLRTKRRIGTAAEGQHIEAHGVGTATLEGKKGERIDIKNVLHVPDLSSNLLSLQALADDGYTIVLRKNGGVIVQNASNLDELKLSGVNLNRNHGFWTLNEVAGHRALKASEPTPTTPRKTLMEWHQDLAHVNRKTILEAAKTGSFEGLSMANISDPESTIECDSCRRAKTHRKHIPRTRTTPLASEPFQVIHTDLSGRLTKSIDGFHYYMTFVDEHSRYIWVELLAKKSGAHQAFKEFVAYCKNHHDTIPKFLMSDQGGEYINKLTDDFCKKKGIIQIFSPARDPRLNGTAERVNRTLKESNHASLLSGDLPANCWSYGVRSAARMRNRVPNSVLKDHNTSYQIIHKHKPPAHDEYALGDPVWGHVNKEERAKGDILADKGEPGKFLGHSINVKGAKVILLDTPRGRRQIIQTVHCYFKPRKAATRATIPDLDGHGEMGVGVEEPAVPAEKDVEVEDREEGEEEAKIEGVKEDDEAMPAPKEPTPLPRRSQRLVQVAPPRRSQRLHTALIDTSFTIPSEELRKAALFALIAGSEPKGHTNAMRDENADLWLEAEKDEVEALDDAETGIEVELPVGAKALGGDFVYRKKTDSEGNTIRWKARYVGGGHKQPPGTYELTWSPTGQLDDLRIFISFAVSNGLVILSYDVKSAYLHASLNRPKGQEIYIQLPPGHGRGKLGPNGRPIVWHLLKALYGLKQSGRCWWLKLDHALLAIGFERLSTDWGFYRIQSDRGVVWMFVWVDNIFVAVGGDLWWDIFPKLAEEFHFTGGDPIDHELGLKFERETPTGPVKLTMTAFVTAAAKEFRVENANPVSTPMEEDGGRLEKDSGEELPVGVTVEMYQRLVGMLMWAYLTVFPIIGVAVGIIAQFSSNPRAPHWKAALHCLKYLFKIRREGLLFGRESAGLGDYEPGKGELVLFGDANFNTAEDGKSREGYLGFRGTDLISWASRKQDFVSQSTAESEVGALTEMAKEAVHQDRKFVELDIKEYDDPPRTYGDAEAAIAIANNPAFKRKTKHIHRRHLYVRELVENHEIDLLHIPGKINPSDAMTKPLGKGAFERCKGNMGVGDFPRSNGRVGV